MATNYMQRRIGVGRLRGPASKAQNGTGTARRTASARQSELAWRGGLLQAMRIRQLRIRRGQSIRVKLACVSRSVPIAELRIPFDSRAFLIKATSGAPARRAKRCAGMGPIVAVMQR